MRELLRPFAVALDAQQAAQAQTYLELLLRWNQKINLTSIRDPEQVITRHFGEALFLHTRERLTGNLLDIGSGAGFPGLALKIVLPGIPATLLEPIAKKRAFLKEVIRSCGFDAVEVRPERLEEAARQGAKFSVATARAIGPAEQLAGQCIAILSEGGKLYLWTTQGQSENLGEASGLINWTQRLAIPLSREREILIGVRQPTAAH
ncbi:MAG TPA: 16S rRNA (guanine(527)-N(7))-methyltransferase RsmG [Terriglobia bacterium]|nr:16S rRNA (guanine(527)-N(7))-methyltransferase RsmG [Terriglobia bacterium]